MYRIAVTDSFEAGHILPDYDGKCANQHGHSYRIQVMIRAKTLTKQGMVCDFVYLRSILKGIILKLDHNNIMTTAERLAESIYRQVKSDIKDDRLELERVRIWETERCFAEYDSE